LHIPLGESWWAHQDSNLGPTDYESLADNQPQQPASRFLL